MADFTSDEHTDNQQKDTRPSQIVRSEKAVQDVLKAIDGFLDHFEIERKENVFCLASYTAVKSLIESDVLRAEEAGKTAYENFMQCRIIDKTIDFHAPSTKLKLETFKSAAKRIKLSGSKRKQLESKASRILHSSCLLLLRNTSLIWQNVLNTYFVQYRGHWEHLMASLVRRTNQRACTALRKTSQELQGSNDFMVVTDGNALFYSIGKALETFKDLASFIFDMIPNIPQVHFSTDMYKEFFVKSMERSRRGNSDVLIIKRGSTKVLQDFLCNEENKKQLICLLLKEWSDDCYAPRIGNRNIYFVCEEECSKLEADSSKVKCTKIANLGTSQEEMDTKVVLHMIYAADSHHYSAILVRSPDSDIFILLYYAAEVNATIIFGTGHGNNGHLLDLSALSTAYGQEYCEALLSLMHLHAVSQQVPLCILVRSNQSKYWKNFYTFRKP